MLTLFKYILRIKISKIENEDDLNPFLNGPNFMSNGIIIPMLLIKANVFKNLPTRRYIFQLRKYEYKVFSESIDSDDTNLFYVDLAE